MSCKKHGYTNNTFCPACDLETLENAMPNSTNVNEERIAKAISGSLLIVWSGESDKVAEGIWSQHRLTAERVAEALGVGNPDFDREAFLKTCHVWTPR